MFIGKNLYKYYFIAPVYTIFLILGMPNLILKKYLGMDGRKK